MLKGLEISEIKISGAIIAHYDFRFDSEFYEKEKLQKELKLKALTCSKLGDLSELISGPFGSAITVDSYDAGSPYRYIRATDIKHFFLNSKSPVFIKKSAFYDYSKYQLREDDILLTIVGMNFGIPAIIKETDCPAIFSCKSLLIRSPKVAPYYLLTYLSSNFGYSLVRRGQRGAAQPGINLSDIENILVPNPTVFFQKKIEKLVRFAEDFLNKSLDKYKKSEILLFNSIGMADFKPNSEPVNIKSFKESFGASGRLDAEGYQAKYDDYRSLVASYPSGYGFLSDICQVNDNNFTPIDNNKYQYIELSDVDLTGCINSCTTAQGIDLPSRARRVVAANDVLVSSVEGSLSSCALVPLKYDGALCSTGFYVLRSDKINSETLLILFKSELMQNLLKQGCTGTILTAINKEEFFSLPVPIIDITAQQQIAQLVQQSFALKAQSEHLLDVAKRAVEIAIEQDEAAALAYIAHEVKDGSE